VEQYLFDTQLSESRVRFFGPSVTLPWVGIEQPGNCFHDFTFLQVQNPLLLLPLINTLGSSIASGLFQTPIAA
jgi:hypothetical protein